MNRDLGQEAGPHRILYVHGVAAFGGAERDLVAIIRELDRERFTPYVVCPNQGPLVQQLEQEGVRVIRSPLPPWRKIRTLCSRLPSLYRLYRVLVRENIRLVHINDMWWVPQASWAARLAKIPCVAHIRQELEPHRIQQYGLHRPDCLIGVSAKIKEQLEKGGVPSQQIKVFYSGISLRTHQGTVMEGSRDIRARLGIEPDQPIIGTVAHVFPRKGYEYLISALPNIRQVFPEVRCLIVGQGDPQYTGQLQDLVARFDLGSTVRFVGHQVDVRSYLNLMDIMVLPSVMEGFGLALLEAMAMGKPVVSTRVGGIPEVVEDGVTGVLVAAGDAEALASAILGLLRDPERRRQMGQDGVRRVEAMFTSDRLGRQLMELYESVSGQGGQLRQAEYG